MIQAKYIFTIEIDDDGTKHIHCEFPPHNLDSVWWLIALKTEMYAVKEFCEDMYNDCSDMLNNSKRMLL